VTDKTELTEGTIYQGYRLWKAKAWSEHSGRWCAFTLLDPETVWFDGNTAQEVAESIDAALAEVPDPV